MHLWSLIRRSPNANPHIGFLPCVPEEHGNEREKKMSQSMNTTAGSVGVVAPPSSNRWWAIAAGIGLAAVLGYGAALIATDHLPGTTHTVAAPVAAQASPVVTPPVDSRALRSNAVHPWEAQSASPQTQAAVGATDLSPQEIAEVRGEAMVEHFAAQAAVGQLSSPSVASEYLGRSRELSPQQIEQLRGEAMVEYFAARSVSSAVTHSALDPFEEQSGAVSPAAVGTSGAVAQSYAGVDDLATRSSAVGASGIVEQSILDALEERSGAVSPAAVGTSGTVAQSYAGADDLATRSAAGSSGAVTHSALDPFEEQSGAVSPAAVGTSGAVAQSYAGVDDLATRLMASEAIRYTGVDESATQFMASEAIRYAGAGDLATRSTVEAGEIVEQSILDAIEERSGAVLSATAAETASVSPEEITGSPSDPTAGYFDGQWHNVEASNKYATPEFR